jgi:hypothetical protein
MTRGNCSTGRVKTGQVVGAKEIPLVLRSKGEMAGQCATAAKTTVAGAGHTPLAARITMENVRGTAFDELAFFRAIHESGARALLIGRRALVLLGLPVLTADYDFWLAIDDIDAFNAAASTCELTPTFAPDAARRRGRYALENDEHVDVLIARSVTTVDGVQVAFEELWKNRRQVMLAPGVEVHLPRIDDLILTKRFGDRAKDLEDIRLLRILKDSST